MAAASFKVPCPSCETPVLVKDRAMIGKKIDCPKCKYRFVVEEPEAAPAEVEVVEVVEEESPKPVSKKPAAAPAKPGASAKPAAKKRAARSNLDDEDEEDEVHFKAKRKKQGAGAMVLVTGISVALLAFGVLGTAVYFMFFSNPPETGPVVSRTGPATEPGKVDEGDPKPEGPKLANMTNLLPNDTEGVYHLRVDLLLRSLVGQAAFDTAGAFQRKIVEDRFGLKLEEVTEIVVGQSFSKGWVFASVRTAKPVDIEALKPKLGLLTGPDGLIKKHEYFVTPPSTWLDNLSRIMAEVNGAKPSPGPLKPRIVAVFALEPQTLILADVVPLKGFLEADTKPKLLAKDAAGKSGPKPTGQYLTVRQPLKNVLDRIESKPPILASIALHSSAFRVTIEPGLKVLEGMNLANEATANTVREIEAIGVAVSMREHTTLFLGAQGGETLGKQIKDEFRAQAQMLAKDGMSIDLDNQPILPPPPPKGEKPAPSTKLVVRSAIQDKVPLFSIEVQMPLPDGNRILLRTVLRPPMVLFRGLVEMADGGPRLFELAVSTQAELKQEKAFPRGTLLREGKNFGRPFPPDQRISWMAGMLPYLGYENISRDINPERSWRPEYDAANKRMIDDNARLGSALIPAFLDPASSPSTWWVEVPSVPGHRYAATHYVGIAGVGLDAATYTADDPAQAKKMGMFGYDRVTKPEDVKDGLSNTIMIIQVPPTYRRPWIAGGGATVAGVPEKRSIEPFVSTKLGEKRGTYAIMADGSVRFISADISDELFKAMCTINGGEKVDKAEIDKMAVPVAPPGKPVPAAQ